MTYTTSTPQQPQRRLWLWILAALGVVFMCACLACGLVFGPGFVKGFRQGYQQAMATATARTARTPSNGAEHNRPVTEGEAQPEIPNRSGDLALRVRIETLDEPRIEEDVRLAVTVTNEGESVTLYWVAFR